MGVLGLAPFIQKFCSDAIRELPHRLKSLSGKTIAIDGTLITQRLHFAPMPYAGRHVLGWYRLIRELKDSGVGVICVFDGEQRNIAKDLERERRKRVQRMTLARGAMEADRLKRLHRLTVLLKDLRDLSKQDHIKWTKVLRRSMAVPSSSAQLRSGLEILDTGITELTRGDDFPSSDVVDGYEPLALKGLWDRQTANLEDIVDLTEEFENIRAIDESPPQGDESIESTDWETNNLRNDIINHDTQSTILEPLNESYLQETSDKGLYTAYDVPPSEYEDAFVTIKDQEREVQGQDYNQELIGPSRLIRNLVSLFRKFETSVPAIIQTPMVELPVADTPVEGAEEQYAMSKHQVQLTAEEGKLWASLTDPSSLQSAEETVEALAIRSENLTKSYEKRNNPPTFKTYEESKEILRAMGIPCIDAVGPYEAEALAASLVREGFADYVASEDTDVLIFEVPLLRNITNRQAPLILVSGAEIRRILKLDRPSFVDFALLLGTDFSQRIKNLGPSRAIKLIQTHRRIEEVITKEPQFIPRQPRDEYLQQVALARSVFETLPPVPSSDSLQQKETDNNLVIALLERHRVFRAAMADWDYSTALSGNYFNDNPTM